MPDNGFTVLLDKKSDGSVLMGKPFHKPCFKGLGDSIDELLNSGLLHVPTFRLIGGGAHAGIEDGVWTGHDTRAERITAYDRDGILGPQGMVYALDIQNGGLFVWNTRRIMDALKNRAGCRYMPLDQKEINAVLDGIKRQDYECLKELVHGEKVVFAGDYNEFLKASAASDFAKGMESTYLVLRPAAEARILYPYSVVIDAQRNNPDLIIAAGGVEHLNNLLDKAKGFGWSEIGADHDSYKYLNSGRVVIFFGGPHCCISAVKSLHFGGSSVGVKPEELKAFYR